MQIMLHKHYHIVFITAHDMKFLYKQQKYQLNRKHHLCYIDITFYVNIIM